MRPFAYARATTAEDAMAQHAMARNGDGDGARYLGGGTNLVDLMRLGVEEPSGMASFLMPRARKPTVSRETSGDHRKGAREEMGRSSSRE